MHPSGGFRWTDQKASVWQPAAVLPDARSPGRAWWMTSVFHRHGDHFDARQQLGQLERLCASEAAQREPAENDTGVPVGS